MYSQIQKTAIYSSSRSICLNSHPSLSDSKLQSDVSPLLCFRRPGSLSGSFKGDSSWHNMSRKGHAFSARRKREGCIRIEVAPLPSSHTNSSLFSRIRRRILTCSSCTTPSGHCHPLSFFIHSRVELQGIVLTRRKLAMDGGDASRVAARVFT